MSDLREWLVVLPLVMVIASAWLTGQLRRYALNRSLMDVPNERSSHMVPTPRGGGVAIVVCTLVGLPLLTVGGALSPATAAALGGAGAIVALVGFIDDHGHIAARWRLLVHFGAAAWALVWLEGGGGTVYWFPGVPQPLVWFLAVFFLVWLLNLYNFMDGIDGIASVEAISVGLGGALLHVLAGTPSMALVPLVLVAAVGGFLLWNFPPARIFMGDAGSGFLGITLGVMALMAGQSDARLLWAWIILLGVFIVDASVTLLRRSLRGERVWEAHRSHAYQRASRSFGRHRPVTVATLGINVLWLTPLAIAVARQHLSVMSGLLLAYLPLIVLVWRLGAGLPDDVPVGR